MDSEEYWDNVARERERQEIERRAKQAAEADAQALADLRTLETERKKQLDAIARATFGWPDDGTRRTYSVDTVIKTIEVLRAREPHGAPASDPVWCSSCRDTIDSEGQCSCPRPGDSVL